MTARQSTFDRLAAARVAGGASSGDAPATFLRLYTNMRIVDVRTLPAGVVLEVGPIGRRGTHRLLLEGVTRVTEFADTVEHDPDWEQLQIDIGDDHYEHERYMEDQ